MAAYPCVACNNVFFENDLQLVEEQLFCNVCLDLLEHFVIQHPKMGDWSLLPSDILAGIALKLDSVEEVICFSAVCHSWNHVSYSTVIPEWSRANKPTLPWLLLAESELELELEPSNDDKSNCRKIFSISKNKCYNMVLPEISEKRCWGSSYGWIVIQDFNKNVKLFNPISKAELSLPSLYDLPAYSKTYTFEENRRLADEEDESSSDEMMESYPWAMKILVRKFIVLKIPGSNNIDELVVFVIHYPIDSISFARPGDKAWTEVIEPWPRNPHRPFIHHAMLWDGKVVILSSHIDDTGNGGIAYCDIASIAANSSSPVMAKGYTTFPYNLYGNTQETTIQEIATGGEMYMVELAGNLLLVLRQRESGIADEYQDAQGEYIYRWDNKHCYRTINFKVFKLVRDTKSSWENVEDLGDYLLFVGDNYASALHISKAPNCQKNAIYYIDDEERIYWGISMGTDVRGHDMGIFDMTSGKITSFYDGGDTISKYFAPIWFMPNF